MAKSYFTFFFTHTTQRISDRAGIPYWIDVIRPSDNSANVEEAALNNLQFVVSDYQPKGRIALEIDEGSYLFDASSTINVNIAELTADSTIQPVSNFYGELKTPLRPADYSRQLRYDWTGTAINETFPRKQWIQYPVGEFPYQKLVPTLSVENPWFVEQLLYETAATPTTPTTYALLTADIDYIDASQTYLPWDLSDPNDLTADRTIAYLAVDDPSSVEELDSAPNLGSDDLVTMERMPTGLTKLSWYQGDRIESAAWIPTLKRGYLPSSQLGMTMNQVSLKEIAISLFALVTKQDNQLIVSILRELVYIWAVVLQNIIVVDGVEQTSDEAIPGLPTILPRAVSPGCLPSLLNARSTLEQAWLGYALVHVIKYLRDKPIPEAYELPVNFNKLLRQLATTVAQSISITTGQTFKGFDNYGNLIADQDYSALFMAVLFLREYLSVDYSYYVHQRLAAAQILADDVNLEALEAEPIDSLVKLFYNFSTGQLAGNELLIEAVDSYIQSSLDKDTSAEVFLLEDGESILLLENGSDYFTLEVAAVRENFLLEGDDEFLWLLEDSLSSWSLEDSSEFDSIQTEDSFNSILMEDGTSFILFESEFAPNSTRPLLKLAFSCSKPYEFLSAFDMGLWCWLLEQFEQVGYRFAVNYNDYDYERVFRFVDHGLYQYGIVPGGIEGHFVNPSVAASSWMAIAEAGASLIAPLTFRTHAEAGKVLTDFAYHEMRRMWPFGYRWNEESAEEGHTGTIGQTLLGAATTHRAWYLTYMLFKEGMYLHTAQAWALDLWGQLLGRTRPVLQSDDYYRDLLLFILTRDQATLESLQETVNKLYGTAVTIKQPDLYEIQLDGEWVPWLNTPEQNLLITDATPVKSRRPQYPILITTVNTPVNQRWDETVATLEVQTEGHLDDFEKEFLPNVSAGIKTNVMKRLYNSTTRRSYANSFVKK